MQAYIKASTEEEPKFELDPANNVFVIEGRSIPEDSVKIYEPVIQWIKEYVKNPNPRTCLELNFEYLNSASTKRIVQVIQEFEKVLATGNEIHIIWKYETDDLMIYERGDDIKNVVNATFELVEIPCREDEDF